MVFGSRRYWISFGEHCAKVLRLFSVCSIRELCWWLTDLRSVSNGKMDKKKYSQCMSNCSVVNSWCCCNCKSGIGVWCLLEGGLDIYTTLTSALNGVHHRYLPVGCGSTCSSKFGQWTWLGFNQHMTILLSSSIILSDSYTLLSFNYQLDKDWLMFWWVVTIIYFLGQCTYCCYLARKTDIHQC